MKKQTPHNHRKMQLRTLKNLEIETEDGDIYSTTLKYEAIKWIE